LREAEPREDLLGAVAAVELVVVRELLVQLGQFAAQLDLILLGRGLRECALRRRDARLEMHAPRHARQHAVDKQALGQLGHFLGQIRRAGPPHELHAARIRLDAAAEDLHQRALAAAVRPDQADAIAVAQGEARVLEQHLGPIAERDAARVQERHGPRSLTGAPGSAHLLEPDDGVLNLERARCDVGRSVSRTFQQALSEPTCAVAFAKIDHRWSICSPSQKTLRLRLLEPHLSLGLLKNNPAGGIP
jgi:hypothetical protein